MLTVLCVDEVLTGVDVVLSILLLVATELSLLVSVFPLIISLVVSVIVEVDVSGLRLAVAVISVFDGFAPGLVSESSKVPPCVVQAGK